VTLQARDGVVLVDVGGGAIGDLAAVAKSFTKVHAAQRRMQVG
jgi:hypothetical protein